MLKDKALSIHFLHYKAFVSFISILLCCFFSSVVIIHAQIQNSCDPIVECHDYFGTSHQYPVTTCTYCGTCTQSCFQLTASQVNPLIYSFIALDPYISIDIMIDPLDLEAVPPNYFDIKTLIADENFENCYSVDGGCGSFNSNYFVEKNDLEIGKTYHFVVLSCNLGTGPVDFTFNDQPTNRVEELIIGFEVAPADDCRQFDPKEWPFCRDDKFRVWPILNEEIHESIFNGSRWEFIYESAEHTGSFIAEYPFDFVDIPIEEPGTYDIHFKRLIDFGCEELFEISEYLLVEDVIITDDPILHDKEYTLCQINLENGFRPDHPWTGGSFTEPGTYFNYLLEECECAPYQRVTIYEIVPTIGEVYIDLCPQDLPFEVFEDLVIQHGDVINGDIYTIPYGSVYEGYIQETCDSTFLLFTSYVDDPDICNQCELPYSIKLDNLVACIPFDNSNLDVSLHNNHSALINGAAYHDDRFGNPGFAIRLDGINDYIKIDHSEDFLEDQFSFSFWFNKSENTFTDLNPKEALIYKGLEGSNNKTFSLTLEEHLTDKMLLDFRLNSGSYEKQIQYGALEYDKWYHIAVINDFGNLKLIINGNIAESNNGNTNIRFNQEDILLGVIPSNSGNSGYFKGKIDEFRFWKRSLSDREGYLLYRPEADFHVTKEYFLSCCESVAFHGQVYDTDTDIDTVTVFDASPTGEDSLYIIRISKADQAPVILQEFIPQNIFVKVSTMCDAPCQTVVEWTDPPMEAYADNCSELAISQSHNSPLIITNFDETIEVTYTATDNCGQTTEASFMIFLDCNKTSSPEIPDPSMLVPFAENLCFGEHTSVCSGSEISWTLLHTDLTTQLPTVYLQDFIADWLFTLDLPGGTDTLNFVETTVPMIDYTPIFDGEYTLCLHSISNLCHAIDKKLCQTIMVNTPEDLEHGTFNICNSEVDNIATLFPDLSEDLVTHVLSMPFGESQQIEIMNECRCPLTESVTINVVNDYEPEPVHLEICESDLPYDYNGIQILEGDSYFNTLFTLPQNSVYSNDLGMYCDSSILLTTSIIPTISSYNEISICEGEEFHGLSEEGYYEFMDISSTGCDSISIIELFVLPSDHIDCQSTSIQNIDPSKISVYPNPASDLLVVRLDSPGQEDMRYQLISINGKIIQQGMISKRIYPIEIKNMESGVYILLLQRDTDLVTLRTIVIE